MLCRIVTKIKIWHIFFAESSCCHKMEFFKNSLRNALTVKKKKKNARDIILHKCNINHNHMIYGSWDIKCNRQIFFVILGHILTFYPPNSPKNENIKKMKTPGDIIILHKCTKTHDHMLYCSWDMVRDRCNCCFLFWAIFCPFTAWKIKISKNWKKHQEASSYYTSLPKIMIICYTAPEIWHATHVIVIFHFGQFFALLPL